MFAIAVFLMSLQLACSESQIAIGNETIQVEIANTAGSQQQGLMGRKHLLPNTGMLFVYDHPQFLTFWMKDTHIPLSIAFFDENKKLIETVDMPVHTSKDPPPLFRSPKPALYALEVPEHWFQEKGIKAGMEFSFLDRSDSLE